MQNLTTQLSLETPVGWLNVTYSARSIGESFFSQTPQYSKSVGDNFGQLISYEVSDYFNNPKHAFEIPLNLIGTPYQKKVWQALTDIPSGEQLTYGQLAQQLKSSPRAIGQACKSNPTALFVPCHRVVGQNDIGGFMGNCEGALHFKMGLLDHEAIDAP